MDPRIDPRLAADLSKPRDEKLAADLSKQGIEARRRLAKSKRAMAWVRVMNRTFKGIAGSKTRDGYAAVAMKKFGIEREDD